MHDSRRVLLIGSGGREHAIARRLTQSPRLERLWVTSQTHPGLLELGTPVDCPVHAREIYRLVSFCDRHAIDLVVIGPEDPLAEGFADALASNTRLVFGPTKQAAKLEADKAWAKQLMRSASIPTAESRTFTDPEKALAYVESREEPLVVKAAGLAKGKGVIVCSNTDEARDAVERIMKQRVFGDAGSTVIIEERLTGPEISVLALVDGRTICIMPPCQDHKRLLDNDRGPNTGGMGAFCPTPLATDDIMQRVEREILIPTVDALRREGITYRGVLYAGLMLTHAGPKVLEFNVRFGDPETQPLLARFRGDFLTLCEQTAAGRLADAEFTFDGRSACCVVLASAGYPDKPRTGDRIQGLDAVRNMDNVVIDFAGAARDEQGHIVTAGGRVMGITALGDTLESARSLAYEAAGRISFPGMQYRTDIASQATAGQRA